MSLIICPECGHENQEDARYCDMCGIELPFPSPPEIYSEVEENQPIAQEEESAPNMSEEMYLEPEPEIQETPIAETPEFPSSESEEMMEGWEEETPIAETPIAETPVAETPEVAPPIFSATVLDWDEPELSSVPSTSLEVIQAALVHPETDTRFELPCGEKLIYLGRVNDEMPVQVDLSNLPNADIISRVHAVIHVEEEKFYLEDAGSLNETALNGETVKPGARFRKPLKSGDTITFGRNRKISLTFEIEE